MWVWSDELADRFPAIRPQQEMTIPLVAYAVEHGADLEDFAREVLTSPGAGANLRRPSHGKSPTSER